VITIKTTEGSAKTLNQGAADETMGKRILLLEDDAPFRLAITTELRAEGYIVFTAEDGQRALEMIRHVDGDVPVDMIITDLVMPRVTGVEFLEKLRTLGKEIPVVVITGSLNQEVEEILNGLGHSEILEKPFTIEDLLASMERQLA
jgi:CheY-like chemotaxis protein